VSDALADPDDAHVERRLRFEERAAVIEYDGGVPRAEAERRAREAEVDGFVRLEDEV
jgi:hypothetical protein